MFGAPPITVAVSEEVHLSLLKALGLLGLGRSRVVKVPVDGQGRMRPDAIPPLTRPAIICTQVGNVNTGACDPVGEIWARAKELGAWVHVDGAFGLWVAAAPSLAHLTAGNVLVCLVNQRRDNVPFDPYYFLATASESLKVVTSHGESRSRLVQLLTIFESHSTVNGW